MPFWDDDGPTEEGYLRQLSLAELGRRIHPRIRPFRGTIVRAVLLMLAAVGAELAGPLLLRRLIDTDIPAATRTGSIEGVLVTAALYLALFLAGSGAGFVQVLLILRMGLTLVTRLKRDTFDHLLTLGLDYFDRHPPGRLMARVESDAERLQILFSEVALALLRSILLLAGTLAVMMHANWRITLGLILLLVPLVVGGLFFLRFLRRIYATVRRLYARLNTFVTEYLQAVPILQVFGRTGWAQARLEERNRERYKAERSAAFLEYGFWSLFHAIEVVAVIVILRLGFGDHRLVAGMTLGTLVLFVEYTRRLFFLS